MNKPRIYFLFCCVLLLSFQGTSHAQNSEVEPTLREKKTEEGFLFNLRDLVKESKKKIESVNDRLMDQAKERRNQERELKAREYFEKAERLTAEGEVKDAIKLYEKAIEITSHPEMEGYIDQSVKRQKAQAKALEDAEKRQEKRLEQERGYTAKEVDEKYQKAEKYYKKDKYIEAKNLFEEVDRMFPDHKATRSYLALIDIQIENQQREIIASELENDFLDNPQKKRWRNELERREMERREKLEAQAEEVYQAALSLYKDNQFELAKEKFKEVEWILPDYRKTLSYLRKVDKDIEESGVRFSEEEKTSFFKRLVRRERQEEKDEMQRMERAEYYKARDDEARLKEEAEFVYDTAVALYKKGYYNQSYDKFIEVEQIYADYKDSSKYLERLSKKIPERIEANAALKDQEEQEGGFLAGIAKLFSSDEEEEELDGGESADLYISESSPAHIKQFGLEAQEKYDQAIAFYNDGNIIEAQRKFIAVEALVPGFKDTRKYLSRLDEDAFKGVPSLVKKDAGQKSSGSEMVSKGVNVPKDGGSDSTSLDKDRLPSDGGDLQEAMDQKESVWNHMSGDVKEMYAIGKRYYKSKNYKLARDMFMSVEEQKPGYRSAQKYLTKIEENLERERQERLKYQEKEIVKSKSYSFERKEDGALSEAEKQKRIAELKAIALAPGDSSMDQEQMTEEFMGNEEVVLNDPSGEFTKREEKKFKKRQKQIKKMAEENTPDIDGNLKVIVKDVYQEGKELYKEKKYPLARAKFVMVEQLKPNYRDAKMLIKRIDRKIASSYEENQNEFAQEEKYQGLSHQEYLQRLANQREIDESLTRQAREERMRRLDAEAEKLAEARRAKPKVEVAFVDPEEKKTQERERQDEAEIMKKNPPQVVKAIKVPQPPQKSEQPQEMDQPKNSLISSLTQSLLEPFKKDHDEDMAQVKNEMVSEPTRISSRELEQMLTEEELETYTKQQKEIEKLVKRDYSANNPLSDDITEDLYREAKQFYKEKDYASAKVKLLMIEELRPDYRSTRSLIKKADQKLLSSKVTPGEKVSSVQEKISTEPLNVPPKINPQLTVEDLYKEAKRLYDEEQYALARSRFAEVERLKPGYRSAKRMIEKSDEKIMAMQDDLFGEKFEQERSLAKLESQMEGVQVAKAKHQAKDLYKGLTEKEYKKQIEFQRKLQEESVERARQARLRRQHAVDESAIPFFGSKKEDENVSDDGYATLSDQEYQKRLMMERAHKEQLIEQARLERLRRQEQEEILKMQEKEAFLKAQSEKERELEEIARAEIKHQEKLRKAQLEELKQSQINERNIREAYTNQADDELEHVRRETLQLLKDDREAEAIAKITQYEELLDAYDLTESERIHKREQFSSERMAIIEEHHNKRMDKERKILTKLKRISSKESTDELERKRLKEIEELERRIKEEERSLARAKRKEEIRLSKLRERHQEHQEKLEELAHENATLAVDAEMPEGILGSAGTSKNNGLQAKQLEELNRLRKIESMERKKEEMARAFEEQQREIEKERERVKKELARNVKNLYKKAVKLYKQDNFMQAAIIFSEIDRLSPDYKKTRDYLLKMPSRTTLQNIPQNQEPYTYARPSVPRTQNRKDAIMNALDQFESKLW